MHFVNYQGFLETIVTQSIQKYYTIYLERQAAFTFILFHSSKTDP